MIANNNVQVSLDTQLVSDLFSDHTRSAMLLLVCRCQTEDAQDLQTVKCF